MKRNKLVIACTGLAAVSLAIFTAFSFKKNTSSLYRPSAELELSAGGEAEDAGGAIQWLFDIQKNQVTGQLDYSAMVDASNRASTALAAARNGGSQQTSSISWNELGPDNVGGRTRAILFDVLDNTHQHMWAGGVGGGLWESLDGANNWQRCAGFFNVAGVVITVNTIGQGSDGALYVGTGEGDFYFYGGTGSAGLLGGGIYKSTDDGLTWSLLSSTAPSTANSTTANWVSVDKIVVDPSNPSIVYAGTNKGLMRSTNGGTTWATPAGFVGSSACTDVDIASNGTIIATYLKKPYLSTDGGVSFTSHGTSTFGWTVNGATRTEIAISPSDPNYVYALVSGSGTMGNPLAGFMVSVDGGNNWTMVTGAGNAQFDPFNQSQGTYDNVVAVDPANPQRAIIGGVELWEWTMVNNNPPSGQWNRIAMEFPASAFNPYYVHSDKHAIVFQPGTTGKFFIGCDGGVFRTINNGVTYQAMNQGYNVTQCYSIAMANDDGTKTMAVAGCQDNGTQYIDGTGNSIMAANSIGGGDGAETEISYLNPSAVFTTVYSGALYRSNNRGGSSASFYSSRITGDASFGTGAFASFVTPIRLWESPNDLLSGDSIKIINGTNTVSSTVTDGIAQTYTGTVTVPIIASPAASIVTTGVMVICGPDTAVSTAGAFSGDATGTIASNGAYSVTFNTIPAANRIMKIIYDATFSSGTIFTVNSNVAGRLLYYTTGVTVNPHDTVKVQDVVQSRIAAGFSGNHGIWITRRAIDFSVSPEWIKIGGTNSSPSVYSGEAEKMAWSPDGDILYVGTNNGTLFRFSNVGAVVDSANGDVDYGSTPNPGCVVSCRMIGNWSGRYITGLDVDPADAGHVIVTLGNYANSQYVFVSSAADTASSTSSAAWANKTGTLVSQGGAPCYSVSFDKYTANRVLVGTEHGVFETTNLNAGSPSWAPAMANLDRVAVFMIRQQRWDPWLVPNAGCFYIGTHGRGMWRDDSSWQAPTGINNPSNQGASSNPANSHDLKVFPNPVIDNAFVNFTLAQQGDVVVDIYDLNGKKVYSRKHESLGAGVNNVQFDATEFAHGTYLIVVTQDAKRVGTGRFVKVN